ncbi:MAG: hypothetical protein ACXWQR_13955, partial [Ktedonobacterales bacterium]
LAGAELLMLFEQPEHLHPRRIAQGMGYGGERRHVRRREHGTIAAVHARLGGSANVHGQARINFF